MGEDLGAGAGETNFVGGAGTQHLYGGQGAIDLATSSFSYLTAGMSQAQDLAAVLAQASSSASGLTISDSDGDSLTLTGVTAALVAADPIMFEFT